MRHAPFRPALEAIAHTLSYDARIIGDLTLPTDLIRSIAAPTLVIDGETSPPVMHGAADALVRTLPDSRRRTLAGQGHELSPDALKPVLVEFLG
jgi:pimeloyl-ACP methyl ester carboxylesterase